MIREERTPSAPSPHAGTSNAAQDSASRLPGSEPTDLQTCRPQPRRFGRVLSGAGAVWQEIACPRHGRLAFVPLFAIPPYSTVTDRGTELSVIALLLGIGLSVAAIIGVGLYWRWRKSRVPLADSDVQVPNLFASGVAEHDHSTASRDRAREDEQRRDETIAHRA